MAAGSRSRAAEPAIPLSNDDPGITGVRYGLTQILGASQPSLHRFSDCVLGIDLLSEQDSQEGPATMSVSQTILTTMISKTSPRSIPRRAETTIGESTDVAKLSRNNHQMAFSRPLFVENTGPRQRNTRRDCPGFH